MSTIVKCTGDAGEEEEQSDSLIILHLLHNPILLLRKTGGSLFIIGITSQNN